VNGFLYAYVALVLQASQTYNVTTPGGHKYNIPSGNITIDNTVATFYPKMTSYTQIAITGADDYSDSDTTVNDIFNLIVKNTREISPTCRSSAIHYLRSFH
jgi:hypothetical protein